MELKRIIEKAEAERVGLMLCNSRQRRCDD